MIPNSTQIPNEILDDWMKVLNGGEFKVLLMIARKTFGWIIDETGRRKKTDWISYSQLCQDTGLGTQAVSQALKKLEELRYIESTDGKGNIFMNKSDRKGKKIYYGITSLKIKDVDDNLFENQSLKIKDTKETYTKEVLVNKLTNRQNKFASRSEIDFIINEFERHIGHIPSDRQPRRVAQNIRQIATAFIREYGGMFTELRGQPLNFQYIHKKTWEWYLAKDYAQSTEKLETFKLKMKVYLADVGRKLTQERRNNGREITRARDKGIEGSTTEITESQEETIIRGDRTGLSHILGASLDH